MVVESRACTCLLPAKQVTLMAQAAQFTRSVIGDSKKSLISHMNSGKSVSNFVVEPETVIWRIRNWQFRGSDSADLDKSYPGWNVELEAVATCSYMSWITAILLNRQESACHSTISRAGEITTTHRIWCRNFTGMRWMQYWSHRRIGSHKPDIRSPETQDGRRPKTYARWTREQHNKRKEEEGVDLREEVCRPCIFLVWPSRYWVQTNNRVILLSSLMNSMTLQKRIVKETHGKLTSILRQRPIRSSVRTNVSLHLSTHQMSFVDYRIAKGIEYINWFVEQRLHPVTRWLIASPAVESWDRANLSLKKRTSSSA